MFKQTSILSLILPVLFVSFLFIIFLNAFFSSITKSKYPYDVDWIIGKTADEIVAKYGEPDIWTSTKFGYDVGRSWDNPENVNDYYYIKFDENGQADNIYIALQPGG